jgi:tRNA pseudouridine55 synthase
MKPSGILIVDKPTGITSHDVVLRLRKMLGTGSVGHTGTLDPAASGVLLACVGKATKVVQFLTQYDKEYRVEIKLGVTTDSGDGDGRVTGVKDCRETGSDLIKEVLLSFVGKTHQTPPSYSAVRHKGKRLYQYARANEIVNVEPREIEIKDLKVLRIEPPIVEFSVRCSKGTYVRSLASDIGERLGCGAHVVSLQRTAVGPFRLENALGLEELEAVQRRGEISEIMVPIEKTLSHLPSVVVNDRSAEMVKHGAAFDSAGVAHMEGDFGPDQAISIRDRNGKVLAVGKALVSSRELLDQKGRGRLFDYARVL